MDTFYIKCLNLLECPRELLFYFYFFKGYLQTRTSLKGPPFPFFFGTLRQIFEIFFGHKGSPLQLFYCFKVVKQFLWIGKALPSDFFGAVRFSDFFRIAFFLIFNIKPRPLLNFCALSAAPTWTVPVLLILVEMFLYQYFWCIFEQMGDLRYYT